MTAYVYIDRLSDFFPEQWPDASIAYQRLDCLPADQQSWWNKVHTKSLAEWLAPFEQAQEPAAIFLGITEESLIAVSSFVDGDFKDGALMQTVRSKHGHMHRTFGFGHAKPLDAAWLSGAYSSPLARTQHFIARNLHAFNGIDVAEAFNHVGMSTANAGAYVWMHYGATIAPYEDKLLSNNLSQRWKLLANAAHLDDLPLDRSLEDFAHTKLGDISVSDFRGVFNSPSQLRRQTLKALFIGDIGFLRQTQHRYGVYQGIDGQCMEPWSANLQFETKDPDFQAHLSAATKQAFTP